MAKTHHPRGGPNAGPQDKESQAAEALAAGQFRKARDLYKELCKTDRTRFLGGLVESNRGLALQMIEKGQCSEAEQVRTYLNTIASPEVLHELDLELAVKGRNWSEALRSGVALWKSSAASLRAERKALLADAIVLAAPAAEQVAAFPEPLAQEAGAILGAFEDLSASRFDALAAKLRPLGAGSMFAPWKTFLKGLAAFHTGMRDKARTLFAMLPEYGAPTRAARGYAFFLSGEKALQEASPPVRSQMLHGGLRLLGQASCGAALERAEALWKAGKYKDSYREMRALPMFPTLEDGMGRALSDFYFKGSTMGISARDSFLVQLDDLLLHGPLKSDMEGCCIAISLFRAAVNGRRRVAPQLYLERLKELHKAPFPALPEVLSFGYQKLTEVVLFDLEEAEKEGEGEDLLKHLADCALSFLDHSISYTPDDWDTNFARVSLLGKRFEKSLAAQAAEELCKRFKHEKKAFLLAGEIHSESQPPDHHLASSYLGLARSLDPHDPEVTENFAHSLVFSAAAYYASGSPVDGRLEFQRLKLEVLDRSHNPHRSLEYARVRQGVLENLYGDPKTGEAMLTEVLAASDFEPALWLMQQACLRIWSKKSSRRSNLLQKISEHPLRSTSDRSRLLGLLLHIRNWRLKFALETWIDEEIAVALALRPLSAEDFSESEAASVLSVALANSMMTQLAKDLSKTGVKKVPGRILFKAAKYSLSSNDNPRLQMGKMKKFMENATETGDKEALKFIAAELRRISQLLVYDVAWEKQTPAPRKPKPRKKPAPTAAPESGPKGAPKRKGRKIEAQQPAPEPLHPPVQLDLL
jgi:hypothetical protein